MLKFLIELWNLYGFEIVTLFIAWVLRKLEKPHAEKKAIGRFVEFAKLYKGAKLKNGAPTDSPEELFEAFIGENPQYKERKRKGRNA